MFSLDNFYYIVYANLLHPVNTTANYFVPFGSLSPDDLITSDSFKPSLTFSRRSHNCIFYDQEPIFKFNLPCHERYFKTKTALIIANSEHSDLKKQLCKENGFYDWYYFFHGFAALAWYRDYKYVPLVENKFTHVFISLNRLVTKDRSFRLTLVSKMLEKDLVKHGLVSLYLDDKSQITWQEEVNSHDTKLSESAKQLITHQLSKLNGSLIVDKINPQGDNSAHCGPFELELNQKALWHVVSETIFYYDKLHLTEKIFKPIVSKRPFILVGAKGNLEYLKSYGFKTFDKWIDESYDNEADPDKRLDMVIAELEKLSALTMDELETMHAEMKEVLEYNYNYFYGDFKRVIVDELVNNFENCIIQWNNGRFGERRIDTSNINFEEVKRILAQ